MIKPETDNIFSDLSKIVKGAGVIFSGSLLGKILIFFYSILIARYFDIEDVGIYFLGLSITEFIASIALLGLDVAMVRFIAIYDSEKDINRKKGTMLACVGIAMLVSILAAILLYLSSEYISYTLFKKPNLKIVLLLFSLSIPFLALKKIFLASIEGLKLMQYSVYTNNVAEVGLRFSFTLIFIYLFKSDLKGLIIANLITSILTALLAFYYATKFIPILNNKIKPIYEFKNLLNFSLPLVLSRLFFSLMSSVDTFLLGYLSSATNVAIYNIVMRIVSIATLAQTGFNQIFSPFVADLHNRNEVNKLSNLFKIASKWTFAISLPLFLLFIIFPWYFLTIFGGSFTEGAACLIVISIAYLLNSTLSLSATLISMSGRSDITLKNNIVAAFFNFILIYLLIPKFGALGAAIGTGISIIILNLFRVTEVYYLMRIHPFRLDYLKPLFAGLISIVTALLIQNNLSNTGNTILTIIIIGFLCSYLFLVYIFKLSEEEIYIKNILSSKLILLLQ